MSNLYQLRVWSPVIVVRVTRHSISNTTAAVIPGYSSSTSMTARKFIYPTAAVAVIRMTHRVGYTTLTPTYRPGGSSG